MAGQVTVKDYHRHYAYGDCPFRNVCLKIFLNYASTSSATDGYEYENAKAHDFCMDLSVLSCMAEYGSTGVVERGFVLASRPRQNG